MCIVYCVCGVCFLCSVSVCPWSLGLGFCELFVCLCVACGCGVFVVYDWYVFTLCVYLFRVCELCVCGLCCVCGFWWVFVVCTCVFVWCACVLVYFLVSMVCVCVYFCVWCVYDVGVVCV